MAIPTYFSIVPASLNPFQTLQRHRNFRLFWLGQTLSLIGTWMQTMSEGWLALELSNSAFLVGLVAAAQSLPVLLLSLSAGVVVDRTDKLRLVKIAQTLLGVQAALLWWTTWSGRVTIGWLLNFVVIAANGAMPVSRSALESVGRSPESVTSEQLNAVAFVDTFTGVAVGTTGAILRTANGGGTWALQPSGTTANLWGVTLIDPKNACAW